MSALVAISLPLCLRRVRQRHISHAVLFLRRDFPILVFVDDVDVLLGVFFDWDEESELEDISIASCEGQVFLEKAKSVASV